MMKNPKWSRKTENGGNGFSIKLKENLRFHCGFSGDVIAVKIARCIFWGDLIFSFCLQFSTTERPCNAGKVINNSQSSFFELN